MKDYTTDKIRNVALVAHHGVGKTSLAEAMLFNAKATNRLGRITDGTTVLDYGPDEVQRQITISVGLAQFEWADPSADFRGVVRTNDDLLRIVRRLVEDLWREGARTRRVMASPVTGRRGNREFLALISNRPGGNRRAAVAALESSVRE